MNLQQSLLAIALFIAFFIFGFLGSLGIHWSIRPSLENPDSLSLQASTAETDQSRLNESRQQLNQTVIKLEDELRRVQTEHDIDEGHARALILELQTYRDERDALFADLEARKQQVLDKIDELDGKIQQQLSQRDEQYTPETDYELENELLGLLNYPHSLNDEPTLNAQLNESLTREREFIEQRFELMLQPVDYGFMDTLYEKLDPVITALNKQHDNSTELVNLHCSERHCEIQVRMQRQQPYFDYWQQWLVALSTIEATKLIEHELTTEDGQQVVGAVIIQRLP